MRRMMFGFISGNDCQLGAQRKQALLEAPDLPHGSIMTDLLEWPASGRSEKRRQRKTLRRRKRRRCLHSPTRTIGSEAAGILVCPVRQTPLRYDAAKQELIE